jgi:hypothetical protein
VNCRNCKNCLTRRQVRSYHLINKSIQNIAKTQAWYRCSIQDSAASTGFRRQSSPAILGHRSRLRRQEDCFRQPLPSTPVEVDVSRVQMTQDPLVTFCSFPDRKTAQPSDFLGLLTRRLLAHRSQGLSAEAK